MYTEIIELVKSTKKIVFDKQKQHDISMKGAADFVTAVDMAISDFLKEELAKLTPEIGFMSEEEKAEIQPVRWILDPIDGTTNLVYGYNKSSVSLALCENEVITFGVIFDPFTDELFVAERGKGAYYNGEKISVADDRDLENCIVEFGAGSTKKQYADISFAMAKEVFLNCLDLRRICSSALSVSYAAQGRINGYFEYQIKPWDYAAASLIFEECGGILTDWHGEKLPFDRPSSIVCGTPKMHKFLLETVQKYNEK